MNKKSVLVLLVSLLGAACVDPTSVVVEPLRVINWAPASGAFCVDVGATVKATFSDNLQEDTLTSETFTLLDAAGPVDATLTYDAATFTALLEPVAPLAFDTLYTAVVGQGVRGQSQGRLAVDLDASFQTVARYGCTPGVECILPSDCPGSQICANIGVCIDECVTDKDCYRGDCNGGTCTPVLPSDGGGDPIAGDPIAGDPLPGDPLPGDPAGD